MNKIQKEYQRKLRVNQKNEVFTTFQKNSETGYSPIGQKRQKQKSLHQTEHEHIESLKYTLKSLVPPSMELTKQYPRANSASLNGLNQQSIKNNDYMTKLSQLTKNLEEIASKGYFCPGNEDTTRQRTHSGPYQKPFFENSQTISRYYPETLGKCSNNISVQLPLKSKSFLDKEGNKFSKSHSKSTHKQNSSLKDIKYKKEDKHRQTSSKKSFSKKEIVSESIKKSSNSKNLVKIFNSIDNSANDLGLKSCSKSKTLSKMQTVFEQKVHRHKITSLLVADHIYTSSLDYTVKKIQEHEKIFFSEKILKYREGVEHLALINGNIFSSSRDNYIRSLDGSFFCRFSSVPVCFEESVKNHQISIRLESKELKLFDLNKRVSLSSLEFDSPFETISKANKDLFVGTNGALFAVDWRKKDFLINVYKDATKNQCHWLSDPNSNVFWIENKGQLTILSPEMRKIKTKALPSFTSYVTHCWNRGGLYVLINSQTGSHLLRYDDVREAEEIDFQSDSTINKLIVREKQIIYGGKYGDLIIKQTKK